VCYIVVSYPVDKGVNTRTVTIAYIYCLIEYKFSRHLVLVPVVLDDHIHYKHNVVNLSVLRGNFVRCKL